MNVDKEKIFTHKWLDPECCETGCKSLFLLESRKEVEELKKVLQKIVENYDSFPQSESSFNRMEDSIYDARATISKLREKKD